jgi:hypothetical protein
MKPNANKERMLFEASSPRSFMLSPPGDLKKNPEMLKLTVYPARRGPWSLTNRPFATSEHDYPAANQHDYPATSEHNYLLNAMYKS